jgi:hypothetical protein
MLSKRYGCLLIWPGSEPAPLASTALTEKTIALLVPELVLSLSIRTLKKIDLAIPADHLEQLVRIGEA